MDITIDQRSIHVEQHGQGDLALVFIHYWGGSSRTWQPLMELLSPAFHCVAYDQRGWGDSAPADSYSIADLADDALAVVASLGLQRYVLVGHSMGGKAAQLAASRRPPGLQALVLVAPALPIP
ncbi:alpha/beta fold hydrolase, partial [Duganella callida]